MFCGKTVAQQVCISDWLSSAEKCRAKIPEASVVDIRRKNVAPVQAARWVHETEQPGSVIGIGAELVASARAGARGSAHLVTQATLHLLELAVGVLHLVLFQLIKVVELHLQVLQVAEALQVDGVELLQVRLQLLVVVHVCGPHALHAAQTRPKKDCQSAVLAC